MSIFTRIRQYFCKHHYKKYYRKDKKTYVMRCTKCGSVLCREEVGKWHK